MRDTPQTCAATHDTSGGDSRDRPRWIVDTAGVPLNLACRAIVDDDGELDGDRCVGGPTGASWLLSGVP